MSSPPHVPLDHADFLLRGMNHEPVRLPPRSAFPSGQSLVDAGVQLPGELLVPNRSGSAGSALSRSRPARSLASSASYCPPVMTSGSGSLIRWLIS
jgi:hypothetical protein